VCIGHPAEVTTELWSTKQKMQSIMPNAERHWGSNSGAVNDPFGEPARNPWYVGLLSAWDSVGDDYTFSTLFVKELLN
jgi:hypothetical protein